MVQARLLLNLIKKGNLPHLLIHKRNGLRRQKLLDSPRTPKPPKPTLLDPSMRQCRLVMYRHSVDVHGTGNPLAIF